MDIKYEGLPGHMRDAMRRYVENGIPPGRFLTAVVSNDLMGALKQADDINMISLPSYGQFLYNEAPCGCSGSPALVDAWIKQGGLAGLREDAA